VHVEPFRVAVPEAALVDLRERLAGALVEDIRAFFRPLRQA
jgi:hypothetical protein